MLYLYALRNRSPGYATVPRNWTWQYVEAPAYIYERALFREAFPEVLFCKNENYRHGVIGSNTKLSQEELEAFEIDWVNDPQRTIDVNALHDELQGLLREIPMEELHSSAQRFVEQFCALDTYLQKKGNPLPEVWSYAKPAKRKQG